MSLAGELFQKIFVRIFAEQLVREAYRGILQRDADPQGLASYTDALKQNLGLAGLLRDVTESDEHWRKTLEARAPELVRSLYSGLLDREPEPEALQDYAEKLATAHDLTPLLAEIARSNEHWQKQFAAHAPELVRALYRGLLGREPDAEGLQAYTAALAANHDLTPLLAEIARSDEHWRKTFEARASELVQALYQGLLGREPKSEELAGDLICVSDLIPEGISPEQINALFAAGNIDQSSHKIAAKLTKETLFETPNAFEVFCNGKQDSPFLIQFWEGEMPPDVVQACESWKHVYGERYFLYDKQSARDFIKQHFEQAFVDAFDLCWHPAMRADYFRMCFIWLKGGIYVDADEVLIRKFPYSSDLVSEGFLALKPLLGYRPEGVPTPLGVREFFSLSIADQRPSSYFNNSPIIASRANPVIGLALWKSTNALLNDSPESLSIHGTTGPTNLNHSIYVYYTLAAELGFNPRRVFAINSTYYAKVLLEAEYKKDDRNWRQANRAPSDFRRKSTVSNASNASQFRKLKISLTRHSDVAVLAAELSRSDEHWQKTLEARAPELVRALYRGLLEREPEPQALQGYAEKLAAGHDLTPLLAEIAGSDEHWERQYARRVHRVVTEAYRAILGREPDEKGLQNWLPTASAWPDGIRNIVTGLINSEEYKRKAKKVFGSSNGLGRWGAYVSYIDGLYRRYTGKPVDSGTLAQYVSQEVPEWQVCRDLVCSYPPQKKRARVLIFGAYGNGNLGDIYQAAFVRDHLIRLFDLTEDQIFACSLLSGSDYPFKAECKLPPQKIWDFSLINTFDAIVVGGGACLLIHMSRFLMKTGQERFLLLLSCFLLVRRGD